MNAADTKLLVIGFDGLDHELFSRRVSGGLRLLPLHAPIPVTGPSWTSIYTGDSVATHGVRDVYGLEYRRRYHDNELLQRLRWRLHNLGRIARLKAPHRKWANYATTRSRCIWDTLGARGVAVKLVAMPVTCPVRPVRGVHVGGFPVIRRHRWYWPDEIGPRLPEDYPQLIDATHWFSNPERDSHRHWRRRLAEMGFAEGARRIAAGARRLADLFLELPRGDLQMVQFSFVDRLGHVFGMAGEVEEFAYRLVAELTDSLIAAAKPEATMILSDHGFRGPEHTDRGCLALGGGLDTLVRPPADYLPSVLDVAPTIAGFFGAAHPCEGNDLTRGGAYVTRDDEADRREKEQIIQRLRDLGYM